MATRRRRIKVNIGPQTSLRRAAMYPEEAGYVDSIRSQMKSITNNLISLIDQAKEITPDIMLDTLQPTFDLSQVYVPVDTGKLKDSGYLEVTNFRDKPRVEMGYARGNDPPYAVRVHENLEYRHESPTQAKFLERAINEDSGTYIDRLTAFYREAIFGQSS